MRVLLTGAAGFMGSHLFDYLKAQGHQVIGVDDYSIGNYKHKDIRRIDIVNQPEKLGRTIQRFKPEVLFHLAAWAQEGLSQFMPIKLTQTNYNGFLNTLIPAIKNGIKRVVVCSSMSVYGDQKPPFSEKLSRKPMDIYAVAKTAMEQSTEILSKVFKFEYVIVRPHNVYGPRQAMHDPYRNVVAIFINSLLRNKAFYIYGDGNVKRAFTYIDDFTPYIARCGVSREPGIINQIFNIGPDQEYSINELAKLVLSHFKNPPQPIYLKDRPLEIQESWCTCAKAEEILGYKTSVSFEEGIAKMVEWAKTVGPSEPKYLSELELSNEDTPDTWKKELI